MKIKKKIQKNNIKNSPKYSDFVYGVHSVVELLTAKRRKVGTIYTTKNPIKQWNQIQKLLPSYVQVSFVSRDTLANMAGTTDHQGIVAYVAPFPYMKQMFQASKHPFVLVLDGVCDVRNVGAIIRSAYCAGVDGVVLIKKGGAPLNAAAIKASAGLAEHTTVCVMPTIQVALQELQKGDYHLYLATLGKGENAAHMSFEKPVALVVGSEETGISKSVLKMGTRVLLPQRRSDISYNVSVATGILLFLIGVRIEKI